MRTKTRILEAGTPALAPPGGRAPLIALLALVAVLSAVPANAEERQSDAQAEAVAELARQVAELNRQLEQTRQLNAEQVEELHARIAELEKQLDEADRSPEVDELAELRAEAEELATGEAEREAGAEEERESAKGGQRNLQAMNPEISFLGDVAYDWTSGEMKDGFRLLGAELGFQAALDPYTRFKTFIVGHQEPFELELDGHEGEDVGHGHGSEISVFIEEMFIEWIALPTNMRLAVGKFRQQYGTLNRWHPHALPSADIPFALRNVFGYDGLVGLGVGLTWQLPRAWASSNGLTLQVANASNPVAFAGAEWRDPAILLRHTGFFDLGPSSYFELGLNGVWGANDETGENKTLVAGVDVNYLWEPTQRARYRGVELRGEWIHTRAERPAASTISSDSFYAYFGFKLSRRWSVGFRVDHAELPFDRVHLLDPETLLELEFKEGLHEVALTPYLTFWQSEYVRLRLQYQHAERDFVAAWGTDSDDKVWVQATFAAGPHKHEEY